MNWIIWVIPETSDFLRLDTMAGSTKSSMECGLITIASAGALESELEALTPGIQSLISGCDWSARSAIADDFNEYLTAMQLDILNVPIV